MPKKEEKTKKSSVEHYMDINDSYRILVDKYNYILENLSSRVNQETNELVEFWDRIGYYTTVTSALEAGMRHDVRKALSVGEVVERQKSFTKMIEKHLKGA